MSQNQVQTVEANNHKKSFTRYSLQNLLLNCFFSALSKLAGVLSFTSAIPTEEIPDSEEREPRIRQNEQYFNNHYFDKIDPSLYYGIFFMREWF